MTDACAPPDEDELEITVFGPGYGESIVLHIGAGAWVVVDSCIEGAGRPRALRYLQSLGVDPGREVRLVVATHWHDDRIRGMAQLVAACTAADFCCAAALCKQEFLAVAGALQCRSFPGAGSGVREIYDVFSRLEQMQRKPKLAIMDRRIFARNTCEIWALSPHDGAVVDFFRAIGDLLPDQGESKTRIPSISPNKVAVVLWVGIGDAAILLGSDLERPGWIEIMRSSTHLARKASVLKIPHHGSANAEYPEVWRQMLEPGPWAVLAPWRRGARVLPKPEDVQRLLKYTPRAYSTARLERTTASPRPRDRMVVRTIRESGIRVRSVRMSPGAVRFRKVMEQSAEWRVEKFGSACELKDFAA